MWTKNSQVGKVCHNIEFFQISDIEKVGISLYLCYALSMPENFLALLKQLAKDIATISSVKLCQLFAMTRSNDYLKKSPNFPVLKN